MKLKPIHDQLEQLNGSDNVSAIVSLEWLLDALSKEIEDIADQYKFTNIPTALPNIGIRFLFDANNISLTPLNNTSQFRLNGFDFELELIERTGSNYGKTYGSIYISYKDDVIGDFEIIDQDDKISDLKYSFQSINLSDVSMRTSIKDETTILDNFDSLEDYNSSVKAIMISLDYADYVKDLFESLPTPNVFNALGSYKLGSPYDISIQDFPVYGNMQPFLVVKGANRVNQSQYCNCGEPGGVTTVDDIIRHGGDDGQRTTVERRRVITNRTPVNDELKGVMAAGFIFPFYSKSNNTFKTFLKDFTAQTNLSTDLSDSGKKSGVNWSYNVNASVPISNISIDVIPDISTGEHTIKLEMPHTVTGKISLVKNLGCGVKLRDSIDIVNGSIDPFTMNLKVEFIYGRNGREVILNPETKADLNFRLRPNGLFSFLITFFGKIIDRRIVEQRIVAMANEQIISFIKAFVIPTIPQKNIRIGANMTEESLFIAIGDSIE